MHLPDTGKIPSLLKENLSLYDPSRKTVGAIYRDAQFQNKHEDAIEIGDMGRELTTSLVDDLNDAFASFDKKGKPYYLMVHEHKDLQMKSAILRRLLYFGYRPWPEDDTVVFWKNPATQEARFCWALPHHSEMPNIVANEAQFEAQFVHHIKAWQAYNLQAFGFYYSNSHFRWIPQPTPKDTPLRKIVPGLKAEILS